MNRWHHLSTVRVVLKQTLLALAAVPLGLLCSCAAPDVKKSALPFEISLNPAAGRGDLLLLKVQLENGQNVNLAADTAADCTVFDKSLEPLLGRRLGTTVINLPAVNTNANVFRAPKMWLGNVELITRRWIVTTDLKKVGYPGPLQGILGIDCLGHYCIQLDFEARKWRFLDPAKLDTNNLGEAFPLFHSGRCFIVHENLMGLKGPGSLIDTGCNFDGLLMPTLFQRWTNDFRLSGYPGFPSGRFGGATYTNLELHVYPGTCLASLFFQGTWSRSIFRNARCI